MGRTPGEKRICHLWNRYGKAIHQQGAAHGLSTRSALAVFSVESGKAYDPATGLRIGRQMIVVKEQSLAGSAAHQNCGNPFLHNRFLPSFYGFSGHHSAWRIGTMSEVYLRGLPAWLGRQAKFTPAA